MPTGTGPDRPRAPHGPHGPPQPSPCLRRHLWAVLILGCGTLAFMSLGTWWAVPAFAAFGTIWGGSADSRWHESGHGTVFRTSRANDVMYDIAAFMMLREPTLWRWQHVRHHSNTSIVGLDPEITVKRPTSLLYIALGYLNLVNGPQDALEDPRARGRALRDVHAGSSSPPSSSAGSCGRPGPSSPSWPARSPGRRPRHDRAPAVRRPAVVLRRLVHVVLRRHPARRAARGRPRPPHEHPHGVHGPGLPFPVPQHELPRRAPHVPVCAVLQPAGAARGDQGLPAAPENVGAGGLPRAPPCRAHAAKGH